MDDRVLRRFVAPAPSSGAPPDDCVVALFVDTETTGLDPEKDEIIELAIRPFAFDATGTVRWIGEGVDYFEQPSQPIPEEITAITGITDGMVEGHTIDELHVLSLLSMAQLVIAHNAGFDRKIIEKRLPPFALVRWACSWKEVQWKRMFGASCGNLGHLLMDMHDQFHSGHRALADCDVAIKLLGDTHDADDHSALSHLFTSMKRHTVRVWANNAPFSMKDAIKSRRVDGERYKWHDGERGHSKAWYFDGTMEQAEVERAWLTERITNAVELQLFNAKDRYSVRMDP